MRRESLETQICDELQDCPAGMTIDVIAAEIGVTPKAASVVVSRLVEFGVIEKTGDAARGATGRAKIIWALARTKKVAA